MSRVEANALVQSAIDKLGEHFDAVQIMATWSDAGGTDSSFGGSGNWFARKGMAHNFIKAEESNEAATMLAQKLKEEEE